MLTLVRRALELVLVVYVVGVLGLGFAAQVAPLTGHGLLAVRSASMAPALGVGDLLIVRRVPATDVRPGDVVALSLGSGATVTHRVISVSPTDDGPMFTTGGDANALPDPVAARADQLQGRLESSVALLGFLLAMLSMPSGLAALFSIGATLLTAVWLVAEMERADKDDEPKSLPGTVDADRTAAAP